MFEIPEKPSAFSCGPAAAARLPVSFRNVVSAVLFSLVGLLLLSGCAPTDITETLRQAQAAAEAGAWEQALKLTHQILRIRKNDVEAMVLEGICLQKVGRPEDAVKRLEQAAALAPDQFEPQLFYGWILAETGRFGNALGPLEKAWNMKPAHRDLLALLSRCCLEQNLVRGARYLQGLRQYPEFNQGPEIYNDLGVLWVNQGYPRRGLESLLKALQIAPSNPIILQNIAVVYDNVYQNTQQAVRFYRYCLSILQSRRDTRRVDPIIARLRQLADAPPPPRNAPGKPRNRH